MLIATGCGGSPKPVNTSGAAPVENPGPASASTPPSRAALIDLCAGATTVDVKVADIEPDSLDGKDSKEPSFPSPRKAKGKTYTMADLDALANRAQWAELLAHVEDIPPLERKATWERLLVKAATEYVGSLSSKSDAYEGFWIAEGMVKRYPALPKSKEFMAKRADVGKKVFTECLQQSYSGKECIQRAKDFVNVDGTERDVALAIGKIVRQNQFPYVAVPFFQAAVAGTKNNAACADEDLRLAVVAGLALPTNYENASGARDVSANACWTELRAPVLQEFKDNANGYLKDNVCSVLKAKGELKP
ncbi:hypothetical protein [Pendulispora albinea]|uniref:Lipoprotein n=1 Tax=Pendulispora albinea TaxID=2741071 RepID=A0ABZ2LVX5_9BACT